MVRVKPIIAGSVLFLFLLSNLAFAKKPPECIKDGKKYGVVEGNFREEWYSYQERADSYMEGECWEAALADYERAIELRTAQDRAAKVPGCDSQKARGYGMHFMGWFGHRGRGIALYQLGRIDEAVKELEFSLQCTESSQAQFFLDKARAQKIQQSGADTQSPQVTSVRLLKSSPRITYLKTGTPSAAPGYDRFIAVSYYFTVEEIEDILENLDREQKKDKDYVKSLTPGWGYQVISWKSADEVSANGVKEGKVYLLLESADDQGVQLVSAQGVLSPYTFAQKKRADVFSLLIVPASPEGQKVEMAPVEEQEPEDLFTIPLDESQGQVTLNLTITDLAAKETTQAITITIDREGPQVSVDEIKKTGDKQAEIKGQVLDPSGVKSFSIGGRSPQLSAEGQFAATVALDANQSVSFVAEDKIGNRNEGVISLAPPEQGWGERPSRWARWFSRVVLLAENALDLSTGRHEFSPPESAWTPAPSPIRRGENQNAVRFEKQSVLYWELIAANPSPPPSKPGTPAPATASKPPVITLKTKPQNLYTAEVKMEGTVAALGGTKLKAITVAGTNVLQGTPSNAAFNKAVSLKPGKNEIAIKAVDMNGQATEQKISIMRIVPQVQKVAERLAVSMLPFYQDPKAKDIGDVAYDNLATALIQQKRFRYVDRSKVDAVIRELKLSGAGLTDPATAVRAGKQTAAEAIIIGVVKETKTSIELKAQVVDVDTSRVMLTQDAFEKDKSLSKLKFITEGLAVKLQNSFPLVQGNIAQTQGKNVIIALGTNNRLFPGMRVIFFKVIPKGEGADTQKVGEGKITATAATTATVETIGLKGTLTATDLVITK